MKKQSLSLTALFMVLVFGVVLVSCSKDDDGTGSGGNNGGGGGNGGSQMLYGTKWTAKDWDYAIGEDWASTTDLTLCYYFYSATEGMVYSGRKDFDSDFGSSNERYVAHFTYKVEGNTVRLDYITDEMDYYATKLTINDNTMKALGYEFTKGAIPANDYPWMVSLHGTTGACKWYSNLRNTVWITGSGNMGDYTSYEETPWAENDRTPNFVVIEDGVTSVGDNAFANPSIGKVELPYSSLKKIGNSAFSGASISSISISLNVTTIGNSAFSGCSYLSAVRIPKNVENIGEYAFSECKSASLSTADKLKTIGEGAFMNCEVTYWTDSEVLEQIGTGALTDCSFRELTLPNTVTTLEHQTFAGTSISTIRIGNGLYSVSGTPFYPKSSGTMYVNRATPVTLTRDIIDSECVGNWTLYVPKGSKNAYSRASYWRNFKHIYESDELSDSGSSDDDNEDDVSYTGMVQGHEYVDLGLSVKWATCNIGASTPEQYGDYYCRGRTTTTWDTPSLSLTDISGSSYDAAYENWGNRWRTPSKAQFEELIDNCTFTKVVENGRLLIKVTSNINNQSILFPLAGYKEGFYERDDTAFETINSNTGVYYMTSEIFDVKSSNAKMNYFYVNTSSLSASCSNYRSLNIMTFSDTYQFTVRPITD